MLGEWTPLEMPAGMDFAERLALWVNAFDAIGLQAAHQSIGMPATTRPGTTTGLRPSAARHSTAKAVTDDFMRARAALAQLIEARPAEVPHAEAQADAPAEAALAPSQVYQSYQARHVRLQHDMDQAIAALRERVREAMGRASPALRQLAAVDAMLDRVISPRRQAVMPAVSTLMQRRFEQLRSLHVQALEADGREDDVTRWRDPGGWLAVFDNDWRAALQGELDLRLEPVAGLVEAFRNESKNHL